MGKATEREFEARFLSVSEFAEQCVEMVQMIADGAGEVVVTQDDLPIARLVSVMGPRGRPAGLMKGRMKIHGDIVGPTPTDWFGIDKDRFKIVGDIVSPMPAEWFAEADDEQAGES